MDVDGKSIDRSTSRKHQTNNNSIVVGTDFLETNKADRAMWLLKCPQLVTRALSNSPDAPSRPVAKVIVSVDPLQSNDDDDSSSTEVVSFQDPNLLIDKVAGIHGSFSPEQAEKFFKGPGGPDPNPIDIWRVEKSNSRLTVFAFQNSEMFTMELASTDSGNALRSYSLNMSTDFIPMSVFSESSQGKFTIEGKILNKFDMKPHDQNLERYGKLCRERTHKSMTKSRQIQVIDHVTGGHMRPMPGMDVLSFGAAEKKKVVSKGSETKRLRKERGELEKIIFKLFERQPYWTSKQLIQETDQPEQYMKEILKDLCVYNNKGVHQGTYELKPEYRESSEDTKPR
ncbi:general transcription factor IIF subunit 2 isoform X2 [Cucumis sativus]|uniref:general transcription factor IIF subunit 2 isoform X2 n=1 Tax=Cucumis sativus TaxID=3659 RepID=UPI0012F4EA7C|nr:general transcription factor IIF subunit 2 isoform X2 [Cucumis sativus]